MLLLLWAPKVGSTPTPATPTAVGQPGKKTRRYVTKWQNLVRNGRGRFEELPAFYEVVAKAATAKRESAPAALAAVASEVMELVRPFTLDEAAIPSVAALNWSALQANQAAYERLLGLYELAIALERDDEEDLLLAAMLAW